MCGLIKDLFSYISNQFIPKYHLFDDMDFDYKLHQVLERILGYERYIDLMGLTPLCKVIDFRSSRYIPFLSVTINSKDKLELERAKACIVDLLSSQIYFHTAVYPETIAFYTTNKKLQLPCLIVRYGENAKENDILKREKLAKAEKLKTKYRNRDLNNG